MTPHGRGSTEDQKSEITDLGSWIFSFGRQDRRKVNINNKVILRNMESGISMGGAKTNQMPREAPVVTVTNSVALLSRKQCVIGPVKDTADG